MREVVVFLFQLVSKNRRLFVALLIVCALALIIIAVYSLNKNKQTMVDESDYPIAMEVMSRRLNNNSAEIDVSDMVVAHIQQGVSEKEARIILERNGFYILADDFRGVRYLTGRYQGKTNILGQGDVITVTLKIEDGKVSTIKAYLYFRAT